MCGCDGRDVRGVRIAMAVQIAICTRSVRVINSVICSSAPPNRNADRSMAGGGGIGAHRNEIASAAASSAVCARPQQRKWQISRVAAAFDC